ncbi:hypothetical protein M0812_05347 [Anaeramoeba flamelloides]|uniref:RRM domain-containing protein n=1 Tax=Anaeramoeba flamelloides TaxID=1746091 RepID=A0AAV8A4Z3_9EUKA|nr:hypothetical protein M0812_05347 [Anaeramoeba flamelloides]
MSMGRGVIKGIHFDYDDSIFLNDGLDLKDFSIIKKQTSSMRISNLPQELFDLLVLSKLLGQWGLVTKIILLPPHACWIRFRSFKCTSNAYQNLQPLVREKGIRILWSYLYSRERSPYYEKLVEYEKINFNYRLEERKWNDDWEKKLEGLITDINQSIQNDKKNNQKRKTKSQSSSHSRKRHTKKKSKSRKKENHSPIIKNRDSKYNSIKKEKDQSYDNQKNISSNTDLKVNSNSNSYSNSGFVSGSNSKSNSEPLQDNNKKRSKKYKKRKNIKKEEIEEEEEEGESEKGMNNNTKNNSDSKLKTNQSENENEYKNEKIIHVYDELNTSQQIPDEKEIENTRKNQMIYFSKYRIDDHGFLIDDSFLNNENPSEYFNDLLNAETILFSLIQKAFNLKHKEILINTFHSLNEIKLKII